MTNHSQGHEAEKYAAQYLKKQGYKILGLNWKRPRAEIDIVVRQKRGPVLFVEVKYRERSGQGTGLDYITSSKLEQMRFAAELWVHENRYDGEYGLAAVEVSGAEYQITGFVNDIAN